MLLIDSFTIDYFSKKEFVCPCCGLYNMDPQLVVLVRWLRELVGEPIIITSGTRCADRNRIVGGVENSSHLAGYAVDLRLKDSFYDLKLMRAIFGVGFDRIGLVKYGGDHVHIDIDKSKSRNVLW